MGGGATTDVEGWARGKERSGRVRWGARGARTAWGPTRGAGDRHTGPRRSGSRGRRRRASGQGELLGNPAARRRRPREPSMARSVSRGGKTPRSPLAAIVFVLARRWGPRSLAVRERRTPASDARDHEAVVGVAWAGKASCWATRPSDANDGLVIPRGAGVSPAAISPPRLARAELLR